jgi:serine protease Do
LSDVTFPAITVETCENRASGKQSTPLMPRNGEHETLFSLDDPFGLRKAVVPLFRMEANGDLKGLGTAFAIDPWGGFATADHVVAEARVEGKAQQTENGDFRFEMPKDVGLVAVLGFGIVFGTVGLPAEAVVHVRQAWSPVLPGKDPLAALQRRPDYQPIDLALMNTCIPAYDYVQNLRLKSRPPEPRPGDIVVAIGFPKIATFRGNQAQARTRIEEGMKAGYGRVTRLYPGGRDLSNPTPVFEVEANWPCGMSGGPVFNSDGEVIGVVSRGIEPDSEDGVGLAWATCLQALSDLPRWAPTLDPSNVEWRRGWGILRDEPWKLAGVFRTEEEAMASIGRGGADYVIRAGSWRIGSDDFMSG